MIELQQWESRLPPEKLKELKSLLLELIAERKSTDDIRVIHLYNPGERSVYISGIDDQHVSGPWNLDNWILIAVKKK